MNSEIHVLDLIPAYALDILDEEDEIRVSEHLVSCDSCRGELETYQLLVADLPLGVKQYAPPEGLKDKILSQAGSAKRISQQPEKQTWRGRFAKPFKTIPTWGWGAAVVILLLGFSNLLLWNRLSGLDGSNAPTFITVQMAGTEAAPNATGMLVLSKNGEYGTLIVDGLPFVDESKEYQLWLIEDGQRTSGGLFSVSEEGYGYLEVSSQKPLIRYSEFGITAEPAGGSEGPTGEKVLGGEF
jgi:anti-sigma-K factor RskA